jgi:acetylornithine deacetylase/succinyl-diaminopimelate desuccinylase-like protein
MELIRALGPDCTPHELGRSWLTFEPHPVLTRFPEHRVDSVESYGYQHQAVYIMFRTLPGMTPETITRDLEKVIDNMKAGDPEFEAWAEAELWGPPLDTPSDAQVVQSLAKFHTLVAEQAADVGPNGRYGAYGDGALLSEAGISTCIYGPGGAMSDTEYEERQMLGQVPPDERVSVKDLVTCAKVMTLTAVELCG